MGWGDSVSTDFGARGQNFASVADGKAFPKIGSRPGEDRTETPTKKRTVILDMGEASREQGFRLNGCR